MKKSDQRSCQHEETSNLDAGCESRLIGYARVSTVDQDLSLQLDALTAAGCGRIFTDKSSGSKSDRKGLNDCLASLKAGDTLLVWKLDRLGRSLSHLITIVSMLRAKGVGFKTASDGAIDTTTPAGELIFHVFGALSQFERSLIAERTRAGLQAAKARGRLGGRSKIEADDPKVKMAIAMHKDHALSRKEVCKMLDISPSTLHRYLKLESKK